MIAQGLYVWEHSIIAGGGKVVRPFDLVAPGIEKDVIIGVNHLSLVNYNTFHILEVDSMRNFSFKVNMGDNDFEIEGRSLSVSANREGYAVAGVYYKPGSLDTGLFIARVDTFGLSGILVWKRALEILDGQGNSYPVVVPTKILLYNAQPEYYLVCGYARKGEEQDAFLLKMTGAGTLMWVKIYKDIASSDHRKSPMWCWDMDKERDSGSVVLCGHRDTEFLIQLPPGGCDGKRSQGWLLEVDGQTGMPIGNIVYVDPKKHCTRFVRVKHVSDQNWRKILACGWGTRDDNVEPVSAIAYSGQVGNPLNGKVRFRFHGNGQLLEDRFWDISYWINQDTIYGWLGYVGGVKDQITNTLRGQYKEGFYNKLHDQIDILHGYSYTNGSGEDEELRYVESVGRSLYQLGYRGAAVIVRRVEGRLDRHRGEACNDFPEGSVPAEEATMMSEAVLVENGTGFEKKGVLVTIQPPLLHRRECEEVLP